MACTRFLPDLGGIENHVAEVSRRLQATGEFDITVLATDRTRSRPREDEIGGVRVIRVPAWPADKDWYLAPGFGPVVGRSEWDLVHVQGIHTPNPPAAMAGALTVRTPYVVSFHTGGHSSALRNRLRSAQWLALSPLLQRADALIGVSEFEATLVADAARIPQDRVRVIRNGGTLPDPTVTSPEPGLVVSTGRLERYKGHHRLIEALPHLRAVDPRARVEILGAGPYESELYELVDALDLQAYVTIRSVPPGDRVEMANALARAEVVAVMSEYEAHPVGVMEAISLGRPVVGMDVAGVGELVRLGWANGISTAAGPEQLAETIRNVVAKEAHGHVGEVPDLPTWETSTAELASVYTEVAGRRRGR
ncbi:glycosyltransferase family 4 protein [Dietzia maris]